MRANIDEKELFQAIAGAEDAACVSGGEEMCLLLRAIHFSAGLVLACSPIAAIGNTDRG